MSFGPKASFKALVISTTLLSKWQLLVTAIISPFIRRPSPGKERLISALMFRAFEGGRVTRRLGIFSRASSSGSLQLISSPVYLQFKYSEPKEKVSEVQILKWLESWLYQCSEKKNPGKPYGFVYELIDKLTNKLSHTDKGYQNIKRTKEYEDAAWD